jgi:hypothetical protein
MKLKLLTFLFLLFLLFIALSFASPQDTVTITLNSTKVWWNDSLNASGIAKYANGTGISGTVNLIVDSTNYPCPDTSDGNWSCIFNAPLKIGSFLITVKITNSTGYIFQNSTFLEVSPSYGKNPIGSVTRVVYELPMLIQDLNGEIRIVLARVIAWKG